MNTLIHARIFYWEFLNFKLLEKYEHDRVSPDSKLCTAEWVVAQQYDMMEALKAESVFLHGFYTIRKIAQNGTGGGGACWRSKIFFMTELFPGVATDFPLFITYEYLICTPWCRSAKECTTVFTLIHAYSHLFKRYTHFHAQEVLINQWCTRLCNRCMVLFVRTAWKWCKGSAHSCVKHSLSNYKCNKVATHFALLVDLGYNG